MSALPTPLLELRGSASVMRPAGGNQVVVMTVDGTRYGALIPVVGEAPKIAGARVRLLLVAEEAQPDDAEVRVPPHVVHGPVHPTTEAPAQAGANPADADPQVGDGEEPAS